MSQPAILVEKVSKRYQLGTAGDRFRYRTLRESVVDATAAPIRRFRKLRGAATPSETIWALKDVSFDVQPGEVLAVGDAEFQKKCLSRMGRVAKEGRTVIFVSHHMAAIQQYAGAPSFSVRAVCMRMDLWSRLWRST